VIAAGLDPHHLPEAEPGKMNFGGDTAAKVWKDIWGCGQGAGAVERVQSAASLVDQLKRQYGDARKRLQLG
jgi:nitronate monooxygenase